MTERAAAPAVPASPWWRQRLWRMRALVGGIITVGATLLDGALDAGNTATTRWAFAAALVVFNVAVARVVPVDAWVIAGRRRNRDTDDQQTSA